MNNPYSNPVDAHPAYLAAKKALLAALLAEAAFHGWRESGLRQAARTSGTPENEALALFPDGIAGALTFWHQETDRAMEAAYQAALSPALRTPDRVALAVRLRLEALAPHKEAVRAACGWYALPPHALKAPHYVGQVADKIWWLVGETQTDWNFYSKRALLAGVYSAVLLYWLQDTSENHQETWAFLQRRLADVGRLGGLLKRCSPRSAPDSPRHRPTESPVDC